MDDATLNADTTGALLLINLIGLQVNAVRYYRDAGTREERLITSLGSNIVLIWSCTNLASATAQANILWDRGIPARIVTAEAEIQAFIDQLTGGLADGV